MHADRRGGLQVPFAGVVLLERLVGENARGADLHQVAAELVFQHAIFVAAKINVVVGGEHVQITPARKITIEAHAAITLDAAVHLVVDERAQVLVLDRCVC